MSVLGRSIGSTTGGEGMVSVTGVFKQGAAIGFTPDRNAPSIVPPQVLVTSFHGFPGVPADKLVPFGTPVTVEYDPASKAIVLPIARWNERTLFEAYPDGAVTLGLVHNVTRQQATIFVHPTLPMVMHREDFSSNANDVLDHFLEEDDIIPIRVVRNANGHAKLRAYDIDDDEPIVLAPELYPGTGPWLEKAVVTTVDSIRERYLEEKRKFDETESAMVKLAEQFDTDVDELREILSGVGTSTGEIPLPSAEPSSKQKMADAIREMATAHVVRVMNNYKRELAVLQKTNRELADAYESSAESDRTARAQLSEERQKNQELTKRLAAGVTTETIADHRPHFATAAEWILEEMRRFWIDTYTPADRTRFRLDPSTFDVLPSFCETFETLDAGEMTKAIRIAVHVVTGRNSEENISEVHDLRAGESPSAPSVIRDSDGAVSRRVYVESHTAQARRMHFWKRRDGHIELSRVALHDDFTP